MQATQTATAAPELTLLEQPTSQPIATVHQHPATLDPIDQMLANAARSGATIDQMERLMGLAERMREQQAAKEKQEAERAFRVDFARFKALNIVVPKTKLVKQRAKNGGAGPTYHQSDFETVATLLQPALASCGFGYRFDVKFERGEAGTAPWCTVTCLLEHRLGHVERLTLGGPPDDSGAKNPLQEMQSSSTFLMRHSLLSITGTAQAGKDNDGRGSRGYREDGEGEGEGGDGGGAPQASPLTQRGQEEAMNGTKALNAWWGSLTAKDRNTLQAEFGGWLKCARQADARGQA